MVRVWAVRVLVRVPSSEADVDIKPAEPTLIQSKQTQCVEVLRRRVVRPDQMCPETWLVAGMASSLMERHAHDSFACNGLSMNKEEDAKLETRDWYWCDWSLVYSKCVC